MLTLHLCSPLKTNRKKRTRRQEYRVKIALNFMCVYFSFRCVAWFVRLGGVLSVCKAKVCDLKLLVFSLSLTLLFRINLLMTFALLRLVFLRLFLLFNLTDWLTLHCYTRIRGEFEAIFVHIKNGMFVALFSINSSNSLFYKLSHFWRDAKAENEMANLLKVNEVNKTWNIRTKRLICSFTQR